MSDEETTIAAPPPPAGSEGWDDYMSALWTAAMRYTSLGWSVIPLLLSTKTPALKWEQFQHRQATEEEINEWTTDGVPDGSGGFTKAFGLAIVTGEISGLVVVDCDNQDAVSYAINEAGLFSVFSVKTTRGQHMYFKHPKGGKRISNKVGNVGIDWPKVDGLDLRGDGGYVVAPPSLKFDAQGQLAHTYQFNFPDEELDQFAGFMPVYPGVNIRKSAARPLNSDEWSFDTLSLVDVRAYGATVWDDAKKRVDTSGRKFRDGDGRNSWMTRYIGECVSSGMDEGQAREAAKQFQMEFFETELPVVEAETVLRSVISTDKRNHPDKYEALEKWENKTPERQERAKAIRCITPHNLAELRARSAGRKYLIDPFVAPGSIVQVVGFNGHGKSLVLLNMMWAAGLGTSFGPATIEAPVSVLYIDGESAEGTLVARINDCELMLGKMPETLSIWSSSVSGEDMSLREAAGLAKLSDMINEHKPQIVVIDTVRQAFQGMEENSPHAWVTVNQIAMSCRNAGMAVILVHHRNKPDSNGHGREAGSTAQLKDLDTQIFVTKVTLNDDQAKREAAIPNAVTKIEDAGGNKYTAWAYLGALSPVGCKLKMVFELSFGKLRQSTENHVTTYVGLAEDSSSGHWHVVHSMTPRQKAAKLASKGMAAADIADKLSVSLPTVRQWIGSSTQATQSAS